MRRKALVLSAGGMFGAYQAGAWEVLSQSFQPDIVIGASIGSLNGWAIAAGCDPGNSVVGGCGCAKTRSEASTNATGPLLSTARSLLICV